MTKRLQEIKELVELANAEWLPNMADSGEINEILEGRMNAKLQLQAEAAAIIGGLLSEVVRLDALQKHYYRQYVHEMENVSFARDELGDANREIARLRLATVGGS